MAECRSACQYFYKGKSMTDKLNNKYVLLFVRLFLSFIFIYSGIVKISDLQGFSISVYNYRLLPDFLINFVAVILPWIEVCAGILLLFGISVKENTFIILGMISIFTLAIGISMIRGLDIDCGCFGTDDGTRVGIQKLIENIFLIILSAYLFIYSSDYFTLNRNQS